MRRNTSKKTILAAAALMLIAALCLGLTEEKINEAGGILASKWLPYKMLCMSSGRHETWFDIDKCIVVPDRSINLTAVVDTITPEYEVIRGERSDIKNPINDGCGFYWRHDPHWQPRNLQIRYAFVKGLITPLNFISLFRLYGKEPVVTDLWGVSHDLAREGIEVVLTESQLKLNTAYFKTWDEYKSACKRYGREFTVLNEDGGYVHESEIPYQAMSSQGLPPNQLQLCGTCLRRMAHLRLSGRTGLALAATVSKELCTCFLNCWVMPIQRNRWRHFTTPNIALRTAAR